MIEFLCFDGARAFSSGVGDGQPSGVVLAGQVHGSRVAVVDRPVMGAEALEGVDALVTDVPFCPVGVRTADCVPVLLFDPVHRAVGAVHAGWRGTLVRIVQKAVFRMETAYGSSPGDIRALIGPAICGSCFQVGEEVVMAFREACFSLDGIYSWGGPTVEGVMGTGHHVDLKEANRRSLLECGVPAGNVKVSALCTYEDPRFFSARRDGAACGRNITAIEIV